MDAIRNQTQAECEDVFGILPGTIQALLPTLTEHKDKITSVEKKTFKYGSDARHELDVYYPPSGSASPAPVLFWAYGGTLVSGERNLPASQGLLYGNVGAYFAQKGFVVVIPEVRLAPAVHWPAQAEDVRDAMVWVVKNAGELNTANVTLDTENLVAMGHSAGAVNVATVFFLPELLAGTDIERRFKALVMHAGQFAFEVEGAQTLVPAPILAQYFGTPEQVFEREPLTLFRKLSDEQIRDLPEMLIVEAEKEPGAFWKSGEMFRKSLDEGENRVHGKKVGWIKAAGHNHVSPNWVLGTGEGEEWAEEVTAWIRGAFKGEHANW